VGASGGNWSNANNWVGGAIPTLSNVAQVVIPGGSNVVFDYPNLTNLMPTSGITNNGTLSFTGSADHTLSNLVSGLGQIDHSGSGNLTLSNANTYSGGTNIHASHLTIDNNNALGSGPLTSNGGKLTVRSGPTVTLKVLPSLTVNGSVIIDSDIYTAGSQIYNGPVVISRNDSSNSPLLRTLSSANGSITFEKTLTAIDNAYDYPISLKLSAPLGSISFNDTLGWQGWINDPFDTLGGLTGIDKLRRSNSLFSLEVDSDFININANIVTLMDQIYNGGVIIGAYPEAVTLLSQDPSITFNGTVDGAEAGQNALIVKAISVDESIKPLITFNKNVGKNVALKSLLVETGIQNKQKVFTNIDVPADKNYGFNGKIAVANGISFITLNDQIFRTTDMPLNTSQTFSTGSTGKVLFETGLRDDNTPPYGANSSFIS
jgi:autotransporter-associated beta strand protein